MKVYSKSFQYPFSPEKLKSVSLLLVEEEGDVVVIAYDRESEGTLQPSLTNSVEFLYRAFIESLGKDIIILVEAGRTLTEKPEICNYSLVSLDAEGKPCWTHLGNYSRKPSEEELTKIVNKAKEAYYTMKNEKPISGALSENLTEVERLRRRLGLY